MVNRRRRCNPFLFSKLARTTLGRSALSSKKTDRRTSKLTTAKEVLNGGEIPVTKAEVPTKKFLLHL